VQARKIKQNHFREKGQSFIMCGNHDLTLRIGASQSVDFLKSSLPKGFKKQYVTAIKEQ
jgi:hypothetical protein